MISAITSHPAYQFLKRHGDIVNSVKILALNILNLCGLLFVSFPKWISKSALVVLAYAGVEWIPFSLDLLSKVKEDARLASMANMVFVALVTTYKALNIIVDTILIVGGFGASLLGLIGYTALQNAIYSFMLPWSLLSLAVSFGLLFAYIELKKRALKVVTDSPEFNLTPLVRAALDKTDIKEVEASENKPGIKEVIQKRLEERVLYDKTADLGLRMVGYLFMGVQKFFKPNELGSTLINTSYSAGWTGKLIYEKIRDRRDQEKLPTLNRRAV